MKRFLDKWMTCKKDSLEVYIVFSLAQLSRLNGTGCCLLLTCLVVMSSLRNDGNDVGLW